MDKKEKDKLLIELDRLKFVYTMFREDEKEGDLAFSKHYIFITTVFISLIIGIDFSKESIKSITVLYVIMIIVLTIIYLFSTKRHSKNIEPTIDKIRNFYDKLEK